jgi:UDP-MurNAc hydroxylase
VEVPAWDRLELNAAGDWLTFIPEASPMCHDAAVLVSVGGRSLLHCNDARLTIAQGRRAVVEAGARLDVMAVQTSGASWHPVCYEYPPEEMRRISKDKREAKFKAVARLARAVRPVLLVPFAGPPCFLDPELQHHNRAIAEPGIFPDPSQATAWLRDGIRDQAVQHWMPGDRYDVGPQVLSPDPWWEEFSFDRVEEYLEAYADKRRVDVDAVRAAHPDPDDGLGERFAEHFARLGELSPYFLERIGMTVRFEVEGDGGGRWDVHAGPERVRVDLRGRAREVQYRIRVASRWLAPVIDGAIGWEDLLLSLRLSAWRHPDLYNDYLVGLLKHADPEALGAVERYEVDRSDDERITVRDGSGRRFEIGRYCPHAGEDLGEGAVVEGDTVRCLGHNFVFDLATGACVNARCDPIPARALDGP